MGFSGDVGIWMSGIWISFFLRTVDKSLIRCPHLPPEVSIIRGVGKSNLRFFKGEQGGFFVRGADETFQFKVLHYERDIESLALGFETQNQAPFDALTSAKSVVWRLNTYSGDWRVPARQYRDWMEQTFKPWRLDEMPGMGWRDRSGRYLYRSSFGCWHIG